MDAQTIWIILGVVLLISEMLTGGFFMVFISLGCFGAAISSVLGFSITVQGSFCALVSVAGVMLLREPLQRRMMSKMGFSGDIGKELESDQPIHPHQQARIQYQGTSWAATNAGAAEIQPGDRVVIVGLDGNTLLIRKTQ